MMVIFFSFKIIQIKIKWIFVNIYASHKLDNLKMWQLKSTTYT